MDSDLQRCYQPSMLVAQAVAIVLATVVAIWLLTLETSPPAEQNPHTKDTPRRVQLKVGSTGHSAGEQLGFNGGFVDQERLRIVADESTTIPQVVLSHDRKAVVLEPIIADTLPTGLGYAHDVSGIDFDGDFGLPPVVTFIAARPIGAPDIPLRFDSILRTKPDRPLTISRFQTPRPPRRAWYTGGTATVLVRVDRSGNPQSIAIVRENPKDLGFGEALREALNECHYQPAIVNGRETAMEVTVTYEFGIEGQPTLYTSGNVNFLMR